MPQEFGSLARSSCALSSALACYRVPFPAAHRPTPASAYHRPSPLAPARKQACALHIPGPHAQRYREPSTSNGRMLPDWHTVCPGNERSPCSGTLWAIWTCSKNPQLSALRVPCRLTHGTEHVSANPAAFKRKSRHRKSSTSTEQNGLGSISSPENAVSGALTVLGTNEDT